MRNRLSLLTSYISRKSFVPGGPLTLTIETTAKCNLSCPMCPRENTYFPPRDMDLPVFKKIIDEVKDILEFAVPYGAGEPLLNPEIFEMIAYCARSGVPSGISTNSTTLTEASSRRLIESGLNCIIFAFDGATKETFETYRRGANFDKVRENILTFLRVKKAMRSKIFCIVQMVALKENRHEIPDVIRMWNREGIDEVRIKKDEVCNESCAVPGSMTDRQPLRHPCFQLWRGPMYIHYDGTVFPCCYTYPDEALGNIATTPLRELWNSDKMMRMREAHIRGEARNYKCCVNCHSARPRLPVALGSFLINTHTLRRVLPFFERMAHLRNVSVFETLK